MSKAAEPARLRTAVNRINLRNLIDHLEGLGADAANILRPMDERRERMSGQPICMAPALVDNIVAILRVKGRAGRTKIWSREVEGIAMMGLFTNQPIRALARRIAAMTGQPEQSVRVLPQKIKKSHQFKRDRENSVKHRPTVRAGEDFSVDELKTMLREARANARQNKGAKK